MRKLQRQILWEVTRTFVLVLTGLTVLLVFVGVFQYAQKFSLGPEHMAHIAPYILPSLLPFTIPATLLLTVTLVYGRLAGDLELVAAKAAGVNPVSLLTPTFAVAVVLSVASFVLSDRVIPWAMTRIQSVVVDAVEEIVFRQLRNEGRLDFSEVGVDAVKEPIELVVAGVDGRRLVRPTFRYVKADGKSVVVQAREAQLEIDLARKKAVLHLTDWHADHSDGTRLDVSGTQAYELPLPPLFSQPNARDLSMASIRAELADHQDASVQRAAERDILTAMALLSGQFGELAKAERSNDTRRAEKRERKLKTEMHGRPALSCSCLVFALIGGPYSILNGRSQVMTTFLVCFLPIVGVYYPLMLGMMTQAKSGTLPAWWAVWVANGVFVVAGLFVLRRSLKY